MTVYEDEVKRMSKYITLFGMFETFNGKNYSVYDTNVNENIFSWHEYEDVVQLNSHNHFELKFNLSDAVI